MTNPSNKQSQPIVVVPRIQELQVYTFSFFLCYLHSKCLALDIAELHYCHYEVTESGKLPFKGKKKKYGYPGVNMLSWLRYNLSTIISSLQKWNIWKWAKWRKETGNSWSCCIAALRVVILKQEKSTAKISHIAIFRLFLYIFFKLSFTYYGKWSLPLLLPDQQNIK